MKKLHKVFAKIAHTTEESSLPGISGAITKLIKKPDK